MDDISLKYTNHLDNLRRQKNIKVSDLCLGICSDRQYRRYISGEQVLSQDKLFEFCNKLGVSPNDFFFSSMSKDKLEYHKIAKLYERVRSKKYDDFMDYHNEILKIKITDQQNQRFFNFTVIRYNHDTGKITLYDALEKFSKLVNYPKNYNDKFFDFVDIITIDEISKIEVKLKLPETKALDLMERLLTDRSFVYISANARDILPLIYGGVALQFGIKGELEKALKVATEGIKYSIRNRSDKSLDQLYYVKSLAEYKLGFKKEAYLDGGRCIAAVLTSGEEKKIKMYINVLKDDYSLEPYDLLKMLLDEYKEDEQKKN